MKSFFGRLNRSERKHKESNRSRKQKNLKTVARQKPLQTADIIIVPKLDKRQEINAVVRTTLPRKDTMRSLQRCLLNINKINVGTIKILAEWRLFISFAEVMVEKQTLNVMTNVMKVKRHKVCLQQMKVLARLVRQISHFRVKEVPLLVGVQLKKDYSCLLLLGIWTILFLIYLIKLKGAVLLNSNIKRKNSRLQVICETV